MLGKTVKKFVNLQQFKGALCDLTGKKIVYSDWVLKKDKETEIISNRAIIKSPHALHCVCFNIQTMKTASFS